MEREAERLAVEALGEDDRRDVGVCEPGLDIGLPLARCVAYC